MLLRVAVGGCARAASVYPRALLPVRLRQVSVLMRRRRLQKPQLVGVGHVIALAVSVRYSLRRLGGTPAGRHRVAVRGLRCVREELFGRRAPQLQLVGRQAGYTCTGRLDANPLNAIAAST
eukprot:scaffold71637_cov59-Phaeocystis_antarctica.AAC.1